jgi:hypothetical protein
MQDLNANLYRKYTGLKVPPPNSSLPSIPYPWPRISPNLVVSFPHLWAAASLPAQKRKLLDEGSARELESDIKEMCQGKANPDCSLSSAVDGCFFFSDFVIWIDAGMKEMESEIHNLRNENNRLRDEL